MRCVVVAGALSYGEEERIWFRTRVAEVQGVLHVKNAASLSPMGLLYFSPPCRGGCAQPSCGQVYLPILALCDRRCRIRLCRNILTLASTAITFDVLEGPVTIRGVSGLGHLRMRQITQDDPQDYLQQPTGMGDIYERAM